MLKLVFVSNYLNHHQIPFCNAMYGLLSGSFAFIQTEAMEEERIRMGWRSAEDIAYLKYYYREPQVCKQLIDTAEVVLFGGTDEESYIADRLRAGDPVVRYSERLYKTGQWKAVSPRGLIRKFHDHTRYRRKRVYLLCAGAYVSSDFHLVRAYPGKMYCWGYFPETKYYDVDSLLDGKGWQGQGTVYLLWAGRLIDWKHPELALRTAAFLKQRELDFHMDIVGGGPMEEELRSLLHSLELEKYVTMTGYLTPEEIREKMEKADIFLQTSDRQEGWGAVANEAMNSACALVADSMIGAVPWLIRQGHNGFVYPDNDPQTLFQTAERLVRDRKLRRQLGKNAYLTITQVWNAGHAAEELLRLIDTEVLGKERSAAQESRNPERPEKSRGSRLAGLGPCMPAPVISERDMLREIMLTARPEPEDCGTRGTVKSDDNGGLG